MLRIDGRTEDQLRPVRIKPCYLAFAEGSALIEVGKTRVVCAVTVEDRVPPFLRGTGRGWITAEYSMLPRSTQVRTPRESVQGRVGGRTHEIQRLIGRSLRAVTDLEAWGEKTFIVDCDVLQADGGTRSAAITGAYVALYHAFHTMLQRQELGSIPFRAAVAGTSVGLVEGIPLTDLCFDEDQRAEVDFNVVMTSRGEFVEVQGAAESKPFSRELIDGMLSLAEKGIAELFKCQQAAIDRLEHRSQRQS
ncbi:MAG: ribonuclease PH [Chloroflexi bacterium]|nr:ribonuclease PH [Chloroflexota bacterium]